MNEYKFEENFNSVEKLYHYTSYEGGLSIIKTKSLRFGKLKYMNDINELFRPLFCSFYTKKDEDNARAYIDKLQQISLTQDTKLRMGFDIPSMWGHYADKGNGVCLVFDKQKLLEKLPEEVVLHDCVRYSNTFHSSIILKYKKNGDIKQFSKTDLKREFFSKTTDWKSEQEYRILAENKKDQRRLLFPLGDSLMGVIMHNAPDISKEDSIFSSQQCQELSEILGQEKVWSYGFFFDTRGISNHEGESIWYSVNGKIVDIDI